MTGYFFKLIGFLDVWERPCQKTGRAFFSGYTEATLNLAIARRLGKVLEACGHEVIFTREGNIDTDSLIFRAAMANASSADLFISIHCNAAASPKARGIETYFFPGSEEGMGLAAPIQAQLTELAYTPDRGTKPANFAVLRLTDMPAVLVECGFITSDSDRAILIDPAWQDRIAGAIASGIALYAA